MMSDWMKWKNFFRRREQKKKRRMNQRKKAYITHFNSIEKPHTQVLYSHFFMEVN